MLKEIRRRNFDGIEQFEKLLNRSKAITESVILDVAEEYKEHNGHEKMVIAVYFLLQRVNVPGLFATIASEQIVTAAEKSIQKIYDEMAERGEI